MVSMDDILLHGKPYASFWRLSQMCYPDYRDSCPSVASASLARSVYCGLMACVFGGQITSDNETHQPLIDDFEKGNIPAQVTEVFLHLHSEWQAGYVDDLQVKKHLVDQLVQGPPALMSAFQDMLKQSGVDFSAFMPEEQSKIGSECGDQGVTLE